MVKILANDGISESGAHLLKDAGFDITTTKVAQEQLANYINTNNIVVLLVRSATKVPKEIIDACPGLKLIGRGGVGMDSIAVSHAKSKGIHVINTPEASSASVAELVFAHLYGGVRFLYDANRIMPLEGDANFQSLKKAYAGGIELRGKTLGIIGFGRIGKEVAKLALGCGMQVLASADTEGQEPVTVSFYNGQSITIPVTTKPIADILGESDFVSLHVPAQKDYLIGKKEISAMKDGAAIINTSRGGVVDEVALVEALDSGKLSFAAIDTFEEEPTPAIRVLMHPKISLTPHIGAATKEAQNRIGEELARKIIAVFKKEA